MTPPVAASTCTTATTFTYSGTVTATEPGTLSYQWLYSSGKPGPVQTLNFTAAGNQHVSGGTVKASKAGSGWAEIKVLSARGEDLQQGHLQAAVHHGQRRDRRCRRRCSRRRRRCPRARRAAPSLTATGSITSKKAGTVSYYWALADGQNSAAGTVTFTAPGTKTVPPLTITPPALPASGRSGARRHQAGRRGVQPGGVHGVVQCPGHGHRALPRRTPPSPAAARTSAKPSASPGKTTAAPTPYGHQGVARRLPPPPRRRRPPPPRRRRRPPPRRRRRPPPRRRRRRATPARPVLPRTPRRPGQD